jgi:hypothetical protein
MTPTPAIRRSARPTLSRMSRIALAGRVAPRPSGAGMSRIALAAAGEDRRRARGRRTNALSRHAGTTAVGAAPFVPCPG